MMKNRIVSSFLALLMLFTAFVFTLNTAVSAAEASIDFCEVNKGGAGGFVNKKEQGTLEVTAVDGKQVLKYLPNPTGANSGSPLSLEGFGFDKAGAVYDSYRYMSIEYKYVSENPIEATFQINMCNSNKVFASGAGILAATGKNTANEWATAYFNLTGKVDGKLATNMETHPIKHIQLRPIGSNTVNKLSSNDIIYIGKVTFSESNLEPGGETAPLPDKTEVTLTETIASPETTVTPETLGGSTTGAVPPIVSDGDIIADYGALNGGGINGFVDKRDLGTLEKVTVDGRTALKYTPNPASPNASSVVSFETLGLATKLPSKATFEKHAYISVEYFYATDNPTYSKSMGLYLGNLGNIFAEGGVFVSSSNGIVAGKWDVAYFPLSSAMGGLSPDMTEHVLSQIHIRPFGNSNSPSTLKSTDVIYIGNIGFHTQNPNPKTSYKVEYSKLITGASGESIPVTYVNAGETFLLPECPWNLQGYVFAGWKVEGVTKNPGDAVLAEGDNDFSIGALWTEAPDPYNSKGFPYSTMFNQTVNKMTRAIGTKVEQNGLDVIKCVPVPEDATPGVIILDAFGLANKIKVDLDIYKYVTLIYKYESNSLSEAVKLPHLQFTTNSGLFNNGVPLVYVSGEKVCNEWTSETFEIPDLSSLYTDPSGVHYLTHIHVYPYGNGVSSENLSANDVFYAQGVIFSKTLPSPSEFFPEYMTGFADGNFGVNKTMTRAQACTIAARLHAGGDGNVSASATSFTDVKSDAWYYKYIAYCEEKGFLTSYSGTFLPNKDITRAEFVELIYNMGIVKAADKGMAKVTFSDVSENHPRYNVIMAATNAGLVSGYSDGTFLSDRTITRAQAVKVINNAYGRNSDRDTLSKYLNLYSDLSSDNWAFAEIIDASVSHCVVKDESTGFDRWLYGAEKVGVITNEAIADGVAKLAEVETYTAERINEIRNTATSVTVSGTSYYFAADGSNSNDGLSPEHPKQTLAEISKLPLKAGDGVFFKRGDLFRGNILTTNGVTYSAYGEGEKPKIYASLQDYAGAENWELTSTPNVWKLKIPVKNDVGVAVFNGGEAWSQKRIKGLSDFPDGDLADLDCDLALWHDVSLPTNVEGYVYLRSDSGNPGSRFTSIELAVRNHIIKAANNVTIDNLCLKYTGAHGISAGTVTNLRVQNCEIGWIGGSWFRTDTLSRYGNAVEVYGGCDGYVVDNCYIYQVYDAGITHQYTEGGEVDIIMKDITYSNNVVADTSYSLEYFIAKPDAGKVHRIVNCTFENNIFTRSGFGFGDQRPSKAAASHVKGWNAYNEAENYVIRNNIFDRAKYGIMNIGAQYTAWLPVMSGNTYIQYIGKNFGNVGSITTLANASLPYYIKTEAGDSTGKVYFLPELELAAE